MSECSNNLVEILRRKWVPVDIWATRVAQLMLINKLLFDITLIAVQVLMYPGVETEVAFLPQLSVKLIKKKIDEQLLSEHNIDFDIIDWFKVIIHIVTKLD